MNRIKVYAYTMTWDTGFAPAVYRGKLSLACCKTFLRYKIAKEMETSKEDIFVIGLCGSQMSRRNKREEAITQEYFPVYIAKIDKRVMTTTYYSDKEYQSRPDAQYRYENDIWLVSNKNPHHPEQKAKEWVELSSPECEKDLFYINRGKHEINYVLMSKKFLLPRSSESIPPIIKKIGEERKAAVRSDRKPLQCLLDEKNQSDFLEFFYDHVDDPQYKNMKTIIYYMTLLIASL